jgi:UDP-N-acetylmuramate-alanine ligase
MKQRIHVVGVGGPGMSAIAQVLVEMVIEFQEATLKSQRRLNDCVELALLSTLATMPVWFTTAMR